MVYLPQPGRTIHRELEKLGGLDKLNIKGWCVSDDQVMHLATAEVSHFSPTSPHLHLTSPHLSCLTHLQALIEHGDNPLSELYPLLARHYVLSFQDMAGRKPGPRTIKSVQHLASHPWNSIPYSPQGGGCGGAMRAMCIGLRFPGESNARSPITHARRPTFTDGPYAFPLHVQRDKLIAASIESGRMTHNHPTGFFGVRSALSHQDSLKAPLTMVLLQALVSATFTAYAVENVPTVDWARCMLEEVDETCLVSLPTKQSRVPSSPPFLLLCHTQVMPRAYGYVKDQKRDWDAYQPDLKHFEQQWSVVHPSPFFAPDFPLRLMARSGASTQCSVGLRTESRSRHFLRYGTTLDRNFWLGNRSMDAQAGVGSAREGRLLQLNLVGRMGRRIR